MPELLNKILTCTYSDLFPHDKNEIEAQYRAYAKKVHGVENTLTEGLINFMKEVK